MAKADSKISAPAVAACAPAAKALFTCATFLKDAAKILLEEFCLPIAIAN